MRVAFAFPMLLPPIAVSFTWKMLFDYNRGPVNYFLENLGLDRIAWLAGQNSALFSLVIVDLWQWTPFIVLAALAALESLPVELYEAATVDGASRWDLLWQITLPLVQPYLVAIVLLRAIDAFKVFDTIYILTGGGPGTATEMLTFYAYVAGFRPFNMGFTATISWAIVIIMSIIFFLFLRAFRRLEET
jgi:multiple sugar transport system permease protein